MKTKLIITESQLKSLKEYLSSDINEIFTDNLDMSNCDCCDYFDFDFSQAGGYFGGLKHPIYYAINKDEINELTLVSPEKYMRAIAKGFGLSYDDTMNSNAINKDVVDKYAKAMENGEKFPIGWYRVGGGQEGRHRALAAMKLGCQSIPIVIIKQIDYDDKLEIAGELKGLSREEVNQKYMNKGYDGITDLDWRELTRFIDYNIN